MSKSITLQDTIRELTHSLRVLSSQGWKGFDCSEKSLEKLNTLGKPAPVHAETLMDIRRNLANCTRCKLASGRKNIVFGSGNSGARLVFVGEGPGFEEDQQGEPFVGPAGRLLTKIIQAIHLSRDQVYICNIIKCRPPGNRNPEPDEIETCGPFLDRQIRAISPDYICALGSFAAQTLLNTTEYISRLRGRFHEHHTGVKILPTYHPAYLLRHPEKKRDVWEDMKLLMREMGL